MSMNKIAENVLQKKYNIEEALVLLKNNSNKKFLESVEISIKFSVLPKKSALIKGYSVLPNSIGRTYKIAFFSEDDSDINDCMKLNENSLLALTRKNCLFDILLVTPATVVKLGKVSKLLNGKKVMPDIKYGTITSNIPAMVDKIKKNYVKFKSDKNFAFNLLVGKLDMSIPDLKKNIEVLISDIKKQRPNNCKSIYVKNIVISSTMGQGFIVDVDSLDC